MKKSLFVFMIGIGLSAKAQESPEFGKISISVETPTSKDNLSSSVLDKLNTKILGILTNNGVSGYGQASNFQILPKYEVFEESVYEGLRNQKVVDAQLTLVLQQANTKAVYSTYTMPLKGVGLTREQAILNSLGQISPSDSKAKVFINEGKTKILSYYNAKCDLFLREIDKYAGMNQFDKALVIAMSVPVEATECYDRIKKRGLEIYAKSQGQVCQKMILESSTYEASKNYIFALQILAMVEPSSSCFTEAKQRVAQIERKITDHDRSEWEKTKQMLTITAERDKLQYELMIKSSENIFNSGTAIFTTLLKGLF